MNAQLQTGDYGSALAAAAHKGDRETVQLLIESGADVNAELQTGDFSSVLAAAKARVKEQEQSEEVENIVELLTRYGAKI